MAAVPCVDGSAGGFGCLNVGLEAQLTIAELGGRNPDRLTDVWGWTDPATGAEIAIVLSSFATVFVDVTRPSEPVVLARLPSPSAVSDILPPRDVKVYRDHAYVVGESPGHGLQVLDLTALRELTESPAVLVETARYSGFSTAHNLAVNPESGFGYVARSDACPGGLHIVDLADPAAPAPAGCFATGRTHDVQCVDYAGPAVAFRGRELCFGSNETFVAVSDVTDKAAPVLVSATTYDGVGYTHQGWLTEDHRYFLVGDEFDEMQQGHDTRTWVFDVADPAAPSPVGFYQATVPAVDHNLYVVGDLAYLANYRSGLRIVRLDDPATASLTEVGFFDTVPADDAPVFGGAWSSYPFFGSGVVVVSSMEEGLFVLRPQVPDPPGT